MNAATRDLDGPLAPPRAPGRRTTAPALVPALLATVLGLWGLTRHNSMWRDESVTYQVAHRPLGALLALLGRIDAVHGLYYLLMHGVFALWDGGLVALRLPSVLATALAAAGVGTLGSRLAGPRTGVLAGVLFALFPATQQYAQEGRSYAVVTAGVVWATCLFLRGIGSTGRGWWVGYGVLLAVVCWVHEFAALALFAHAVTLRLLGVRWRRWGVAAAGVLVAVAPLAVVSARQADQQLGWLGRPSPAMWLAFLAVSAAGLLLSRVPPLADRTVTALALPLLIVPPGLLLTASLLQPWYVDRYVLYALTGLALLGGLALDRLPAHLGKAALCLLALALLPASLAVRSPESRKDDVAAVAQTVRKLSRPGDGVLFLPSRRREWLLSYPTLYARLHDVALARSPAASRTLQGTELPPDTIRSRLLATPRAIALTDPDGQPLDPFAREEVKRRTLGEHFEECERVRVRGAQVVVYVRKPDRGSAAPGEGCRSGGEQERGQWRSGAGTASTAEAGAAGSRGTPGPWRRTSQAPGQATANMEKAAAVRRGERSAVPLRGHARAPSPSGGEGAEGKGGGPSTVGGRGAGRPGGGRARARGRLSTSRWPARSSTPGRGCRSGSSCSPGPT